VASGKKNRVSMKGMGADAFFNLPAEKAEETEEQKDTAIPVNQDTSVLVESNTGILVNPQASIEVQKVTSEPVEQQGVRVVQETSGTNQQASTEVYQEGSKPVQSYTAIPVNQDTSVKGKRDASVILDPATGEVKYIKVTYYIEPGQDMKLEEIRLHRRRRGIKTDKSELIREAINKLAE
jgi:hypothetical protein